MTTSNKSKLVFDGTEHKIHLIDGAGKDIGSWSAYNNVDSHASMRHLDNKTYIVQDKLKPHPHKADTNGPYGSYGIIRFEVSGHPGIGVHSGRANAKYKPGAEHATMGCIRTTDEAMKRIVDQMKKEPLTTIEVKNNNAASAVQASARNAHLIKLPNTNVGIR